MFDEWRYNNTSAEMCMRANHDLCYIDNAKDTIIFSGPPLRRLCISIVSAIVFQRIFFCDFYKFSIYDIVQNAIDTLFITRRRFTFEEIAKISM